MGIDPNNVASDVFADLFIGFPKKMRDYYIRRIKGLRFAIFGYSRTGKTTLINRMRGRKTSFDEPDKYERTPPGMHKIINFEITPFGNAAIEVKELYDVPGEEAAWERDWVPFFTKKQPRGIVVLIDDKNTAENRAALRFVVNMIQRDEVWRLFRRRKGYAAARKKLKAFLLLVNKEDDWKGKMTLNDIMKHYREELRDLENLVDRLGIWYDIRACSARFGDGVNDALRDFVIKVLK